MESHPENFAHHGLALAKQRAFRAEFPMISEELPSGI